MHGRPALGVAHAELGSGHQQDPSVEWEVSEHADMQWGLQPPVSLVDSSARVGVSRGDLS